MKRDFRIEPNISSCLCEAEYKVPKYSTPLRLVGGLVIGWVVNNSTATVVHFPGLFLPSDQALMEFKGPLRKTKRHDHEVSMPNDIDINFLKVRHKFVTPWF